MLEWLDQFLDIQIVTVAGTPITVSTVLVALLILVMSWWASRIAQAAFAGAARRHGMAREGTVDVIRRLVHYLVMLVGAGIALDTIGINLGTLFAAGAIFAVGLGFAMQNIAQNFVSGVILLVERSIKPGDVLEVDGRVVRVRDLRIRSTVVTTRDEEELIVPNAILVQNVLKNYTLKDSRYRLRAQVGVTYGSDMRLVMDTLRAVVNAERWAQQDASTRVVLTDFADSAVTFEVWVWITDPWKARVVKSELLEAIWWAFKDANITIAFPQLDVHFDPPINDAAGRLGIVRAAL